jgi:hypothetical protein
MQVRHLFVGFLLVGLAAVVWMWDAHPGAGRVVAFEIAPDAAAARSVLGDHDGDVWRRMRSCFHRDSLLILGYTGFFVTAGLGLARWSATLSWLVVLLALAAGTLDVLENAYALEVLAAELTPLSTPLLARMSLWSRLKWWSLGPLALVLAWADLRFEEHIWGRIAAAAFGAAGLAFASSAVAVRVLSWPWPMPALMAAMVAHAAAALRTHHR